MIHTPLIWVLRESGYTPEDIYLHPAGPESHIADYVPAWHVVEGMRRKDEQRRRVTQKNEHRVDRVLR